MMQQFEFLGGRRRAFLLISNPTRGAVGFLAWILNNRDVRSISDRSFPIKSRVSAVRARAPPFGYIVLLAVALMFVYLYIQSIIELIDNEREKRRM